MAKIFKFLKFFRWLKINSIVLLTIRKVKVSVA